VIAAPATKVTDSTRRREKRSSNAWFSSVTPSASTAMAR
jgi:hypothetical protein